VWFPYLAEPRERVLGWSAATYAELARIAREAPESGVRWREVLLLGPAMEPEPPWWAPAVEECGAAAAEALPPGCAAGVTFRAPVAETPRYLPWLVARAEALGVSVEWGAGVATLEEAGRGADLVVHCAGLGARELAGDTAVTPVRGQTVLVEPFGLERVTVDDRDPRRPTYVIPRRDATVVGGTAEPGDWRLEPDPATARDILARGAALVPEVRTARVLAHRVGLRPARPAVRLELEPRHAGPPVVHCYGHGGAGLTLAWGCADEVAALARETLP
jgi:D-amino-acid oxidase